MAAEDYITTSFATINDVIAGAQFMLAKQISREPLVSTVGRGGYGSRGLDSPNASCVAVSGMVVHR